MKNKTLLIGLITSLFIYSFDNLTILSTGAPIGSTGAPGDKTCARSGCHDDQSINTGTGHLSISFPDSLLEYEPGKIYDISISQFESSINRFGFQVVILNPITQKNSGTILISDSSRTQLFESNANYNNRTYLTYKALGTVPYSANKGFWSFKWKAPNTNEGPVQIHIAAISANNDGTDKGDYTYTKNIMLSCKSKLNPPNNKINLSLYPNPSTDNFQIKYSKSSKSLTIFELQDLQGHLIQTLYSKEEDPGDYIYHTQFSSPISAGTYLLKSSIDGKINYQKLSIQ